MAADEFRFPGRITGTKIKTVTDKDETAPKRVFTVTIEATEDELAQGSVPTGQNGAQYAAGALAGLVISPVWVALAARQTSLKFGQPVEQRNGVKSKTRVRRGALARG